MADELTMDDLQMLRVTAQVVGVPEMCRPTPEQHLQILLNVPAALAAKLIATWQEQNDAAHRCWIMGHEARIAHYEAHPSAMPVADGLFLVDCDPGLYGPFPTREAADAWGAAYVGNTTEPGAVGSWTVVPMHMPTPAPLEEEPHGA